MFFSSKTKKVAIVGPNPPIICKIVPKGCENGIIFKLVNTASPDQAIPVITNVIIRNFANRLVSNSVYLLLKLGFASLLLSSNFLCIKQTD